MESICICIMGLGDYMPKILYRQKRIGKNWLIKCLGYKPDTARIYVEQWNAKTQKWKKHIVGEYPNTRTNKHALSIYNSVKTVKDIKLLLRI